MNASALMTAYNVTRHSGRRTGLFEKRRCDRALGYLMDGRIRRKRFEYATTLAWCDCPDSRYRHVICKHRLALLIRERHDRIMSEFRKAA